MTIRATGPTDNDLIELCELKPNDVFADPSTDRMGIYLTENGIIVECLQLFPTIGRVVLSGHLVVRRVHIDLEWRYQ